MHVRLSNSAEADLDAIHNFIAAYDPNAALRVVDAILQLLHLLEDFPMLGRAGRVPETRELTVPRYPYFAVYTFPDAFHVDVERILHASLQYP